MLLFVLAGYPGYIQYATIFSSELGVLKEPPLQLVDPTAQPCFHKPRVVPYALKTKIEKQLDQLI